MIQLVSWEKRLWQHLAAASRQRHDAAHTLRQQLFPGPVLTLSPEHGLDGNARARRSFSPRLLFTTYSSPARHPSVTKRPLQLPGRRLGAEGTYFVRRVRPHPAPTQAGASQGREGSAAPAPAARGRAVRRHRSLPACLCGTCPASSSGAGGRDRTGRDGTGGRAAPAPASLLAQPPPAHAQAATSGHRTPPAPTGGQRLRALAQNTPPASFSFSFSFPSSLPPSLPAPPSLPLPPSPPCACAPPPIPSPTPTPARAFSP